MLHITVKPPGTEPVAAYDHAGGPFDIGRSPAMDSTPRCVVSTDPSVSRNHARIEAIGAQVRVTNTSQKMVIRLVNGAIQPGESRIMLPPVTFKLGDTTVTVEPVTPVEEGVAVHTMATLGSSPLLRSRIGRIVPAEMGHDPSVVAGWFETLISVQRAPAGSKEFYEQTAKAIVDQIGMDIGLVMLRKQGGWAVTARFSAPGVDDTTRVHGREFSVTVLDHLAGDKRTIYQSDDIPATESLVQVKALVASPVLLPSGEVAGALYGVRRTPRGGAIGISSLEAQLVQVMATAVGIGLARARQEEENAKLKVQLQEQFSDQLARLIQADTGLLSEQEREISILFADIRGFSRFSERLGPADTFRLVSEVMEVLTESVYRHDGMVMDYVGDELIAMWNAPLDYPEHARLAVACAASMQADLVRVSDAWQPRVGEPVMVGVGVNTGMARVGNTGTRRRQKYGALGHTVNLASRVQGATKAFKCPILLTGATRTRLPSDISVRRLGKVKVVGIQDAVDLFQLLTGTTGVTLEVLATYDSALNQFESGDLAGADASLREILTTPAGQLDGATRQLADRVQTALQQGHDFTRVIELASK